MLLYEDVFMWVCINSTMSGLLMTALHTIDMYDLRGLKFRLSLVSRNAVYLYIVLVLILSPLIFRYFIRTFFFVKYFAYLQYEQVPTPHVQSLQCIKWNTFNFTLFGVITIFKSYFVSDSHKYHMIKIFRLCC